MKLLVLHPCPPSVRQDADAHPVEVKVASKGEGLYSCSYTPVTPLKHTVAVAWGGVSVPKSPFRVSSQSQHPVRAGSDIPDKSGPESGDAVDSAQRVVVVQAEPTVPEERPAAAKKPLIIITTCVEERYSY